jgi:hypothetical protein
MVTPVSDRDRTAAREVRRLIKQAMFFLVLWLFGIGSLIAIRNGLKARKLIDASDGRIHGIVGAWVCILIGLVEVGIWINFIATGRL